MRLLPLNASCANGSTLADWAGLMRLLPLNASCANGSTLADWAGRTIKERAFMLSRSHVNLVIVVVKL